VCEIRTHCDGALAVTVDHKVNKASGGTDDIENLQSSCKACHTAKTQQEAAEGRRAKR
jgi:5-methylcytosine-specific restriction protein A